MSVRLRAVLSLNNTLMQYIYNLLLLVDQRDGSVLTSVTSSLPLYLYHLRLLLLFLLT